MKLSMEDYKNILRRQRNQNPTNFVSMCGGSFNLTKKWFKRVYLPLQQQFDNNCGSLVFKVPPQRLMPIIVDIDVNFSTRPSGGVRDCYTKVVDEILRCFHKLHPFEVYAVSTRRPEIYEKKTKSGTIFRGGFHLYILGNYTLNESLELRTLVLTDVSLKAMFETCGPVLNSNEDIYDVALAERRNGALLIGCNKPGSICKPHYVWLFGIWNDGWKQEHPRMFSTPGWHLGAHNDSYNKLMMQLYSFIWDNDDNEDAIISDTTPSTHAMSSAFNLQKFLDTTAGYIPTNTEYKQLLVYFVSQGLDPVSTCGVCNRAWNYSDNETQRFMEKVTSIDVTVASMVQYLNIHATREWSSVDIFGTDVSDPDEWLYYNDFFDLGANGASYTLEELHTFILKRIRYIWGSGEQLFVWKEWYLERNENFKKPKIQTSTNIPFGKDKSDILVLLKPTKLMLWKMLQKIKEPKSINHPNAAIFLEAKKLLTAGFDKVSAVNILGVLGPVPPQQTSLGYIFKQYHQSCKLKKYHSYTFRPYLDKDPSRADRLNCFSGFTLQHFRNTDVDIRTTNIFKWLHVAWCNREKHKLDFLLNLIAHKVQFPDIKVKRNIVAYSYTTGSGKTTIRNFLEALFDGMVLFYEQLQLMFDKFNGDQFGKLFCVIDDIEKATKRESNNLKARITATSFRHRVMYQDARSMPCYMDLICTSNEANPVFVDGNDRRTELVVINDELSSDGSFWKKLYKEFDDSTIMGAWFEMLASRDLQHVNFADKNYRFSNRALEDQKKMSLTCTIRFLIDFFADDDCMTSQKLRIRVPELYSFCQFRKSAHDLHLVIAVKKLWNVFEHWQSESGDRAKINQRKFISELKTMNSSDPNMPKLVSRYKTQPGMRSNNVAVWISRRVLEDAIRRKLNISHFEFEDFFIHKKSWSTLSQNCFCPLKCDW